MHYLRLSTIALASIMPATAGYAADDASSEAVYARAKAALAKHDCTSAVPLLSAYKVLEQDNLRKHPDFAALIDRQIGLCTITDIKGAKGLQPGTVIEGHTLGSRIDGHILGSKDMAIRSGSVE